MKYFPVALLCLLISNFCIAQKEIEIENDRIRFLDENVKRFSIRLQTPHHFYLNGNDEEGLLKIDKFGNSSGIHDDPSVRFGTILSDPFDGDKTYSAEGSDPAAILQLKERDPENFGRVHFKNGLTPYWQLQARATNSPLVGNDELTTDPEMRIYYHDDNNGGGRTIVSVDGDDNTVSINRTKDACAHLHVKEKRDDFAAFAMQNNGHGNDIWSMEIKKNNLFIYYDSLGSCTDRIKFLEYDVSHLSVNTESNTNGVSENEPLAGGVAQKIKDLIPSTFYYKHDQEQDQKAMGFIAEDVELVFPEIVHTSEGDPTSKSLNYRDFSVIAIKAIQEQQAMIEILQNQVQLLLEQ